MYPTEQIQPDLMASLTEYAPNLEGQFMGLEILPVKGTPNKEAKMGKWPISNVTLSTGNLKRSPKTGYARIESTTGKFEFECEEYGLEEPIDDSDKAYLESQFGYLDSLSRLNYFRLRRQQEARIAALVWDPTNHNGGAAHDVTTEWSNIASKINDDVQDAILALENQIGGVIGEAELCLAVSKKVFINMAKNTQINGMRGGGNGAARNQYRRNILPDEMAEILGVDRIIMSNARHAVEGSQADIWNDEYAMLFIRSSGQNTATAPQFGRTMLWTGDSPQNVVVERYRDSKIRSDILRVRQSVDEVIFTNLAAYFMGNITA